LAEFVVSHPPGRALDLGCGTGANAIYLASEGWEVVGVDFVPEAIEKAKARARAQQSSANFLAGDAARLHEVGVAGPFDLIVDIGCYHAIPDRRRDGYAAEVAAVARPGADFYLAGIASPPASWRLLGAHGIDADELRRRFGRDFDLVEERGAGTVGRLARFVLYHLVRT
jgi:cyclopropane fatty-acyl-phospholipid synthase-like methyltransferase